MSTGPTSASAGVMPRVGVPLLEAVDHHDTIGSGADVDRGHAQAPVDIAHLAVDLRLACMKIARRVRFEVADHEAAPHQLSVLFKLDEGPHTPTELAEIEKVSPPSMSRTVGALTDKGYVARAAHPDDGRQVVLTLTDEGRAVIARARAKRDAWVASRVVRLDETEVAALAAAVRVLEKVADA